LADVGIAHEIDAREMPKSWKTGYLGLMTTGPGKKPKFEYRTEMAQLDEALLQRALLLSKGVALEDNAKAQASLIASTSGASGGFMPATKNLALVGRRVSARRGDPLERLADGGSCAVDQGTSAHSPCICGGSRHFCRSDLPRSACTTATQGRGEPLLQLRRAFTFVSSIGFIQRTPHLSRAAQFKATF
jgi:hypothetical protein